MRIYIYTMVERWCKFPGVKIFFKKLYFRYTERKFSNDRFLSSSLFFFFLNLQLNRCTAQWCRVQIVRRKVWSWAEKIVSFRVDSRTVNICPDNANFSFNAAEYELAIRSAGRDFPLFFSPHPSPLKAQYLIWSEHPIFFFFLSFSLFIIRIRWNDFTGAVPLARAV